jgi:hypothetical protein
MPLLPPAVNDLEADPPRRLRRRRGYVKLLLSSATLLALVPFTHILCSIALGQVKLLLFRVELSAQVTCVTSVPGDRGPSYRAVVSYTLDGAEHADEVALTRQEGERLKVGDRLPVQVLPEYPDHAQVVYPNYPYGFVTVLTGLFAVAALATVGKVLWQLLVTPWRLRDLMRRGRPASAVIVGRKERPGKAARYTLTYIFSVPAGTGRDDGVLAPINVTGSMLVQRQDYEECQVGDEVTVLYLPQRPRRCVIYRYADYEIVAG